MFGMGIQKRFLCWKRSSGVENRNISTLYWIAKGTSKFSTNSLFTILQLTRN